MHCALTGRARAVCSGLWLEAASDYRCGALDIANDSIAPNFELALVNHDKSKAVSWEECRLAFVIDAPLLAARDAR